MATVLHVLGDKAPALARASMEAQVAAGDTVMAAVVTATPPALPPGVTAYRVPAERTWDDLLELVFAADTVITW